MCGIALCLGMDLGAAKQFVHRANRLQEHRGPDGEGSYFDEWVGLGHRRLAILDLSEAGAQPMYAVDGRYVLVYNGEIYNHLDLRDKYFKNFRFKGHSDTETLMQMLIRFGEKAFDELNGMWALGFWDRLEKRLLVSRDRYGRKPLYWRSYADGSLRMSSEIKPLIDAGERLKANRKMVAEYLATGNYGHLGCQTFFADISQLLPGSFCWIDASNPVIELKRYWRFPLIPLREKQKLDNQKIGEFKSLFESAVKLRLLSDVKVGATLSGGLDSSAIVAMMATNKRECFDVFTAQNEGSPWDESAYVKAVIQQYESKVNINWYEAQEIDLEKDLGKAIRVQEEPFGDPSIIAHGKLMDHAKAKGVPVILGGQGADELLFGYPFMFKALVSVALKTGNWQWALREGRKMGLSRSEWGRNLLSAFSPTLEKRFRKRSRAFRGKWLAPALSEELSSSKSFDAVSSDMNSIWLEAVEEAAIPHLVHYDDRNAMARSIEGRMPFLDHRLAELMSNILPNGLYLMGLQKVVLRSSMKDDLPGLVLNRRDKIGFFTPLNDILYKSISFIRPFILDQDVPGVVNTSFIEDDLGSHQNQLWDIERSLRIWRTLSVLKWSEDFNTVIN